MKSKQGRTAERIRATTLAETAEMPLCKILAPLYELGGIYADAASAVTGYFKVDRELRDAGAAVMRVAGKLAGLAKREKRNRQAIRKSRERAGRHSRDIRRARKTNSTIKSMF